MLLNALSLRGKKCNLNIETTFVRCNSNHMWPKIYVLQI